MHLDLPGWTWTTDAVQAEQDAYDRTIAFMDQQIGLLLDELQRRGILDNTLVIVTSDHGEEFLEHGVMTHGNSLYSPSLHVPLLLRLPGRVPAGVRVPQAVSVRDLPATVCAMLGVNATFPGATLARYWQEGEEAPAQPLFADVSGRTFRPASYPVSKGDMQSVIVDRWHYIRRGDGHAELYDLVGDPWERTGRRDDQPTLADSLSRLINQRSRGNSKE
jgi:arylsulfatase A-like enzyme